MRCERCDVRVCRTQCTQCNKYACNGCRLQVQQAHVCKICHARRMPRIRDSLLLVRRGQSHGLVAWSHEVTEMMDTIYAMASRPFGVQLHSAMITEYEWISETRHANNIVDKYTRIGNHYLCSRSFFDPTLGWARFRVQMALTEDQKESIAAAAMHPSRLQKWLDRGWEEEWEQYFS